MIATETNATFDQDQQAVQAVRDGDAERYRELVERHERLVFAVAWSRLGDAALAEEVAQEAFIRGYRRLWLLGDGAKFSAWITTITRRVAINFGLRHRRELDKRARWALEQSDPASDESSELCPPETLRQALSELPDAHRECLILYYLEGKSGAEAAAALGISESALRVRLHRARAALREQLEEKLAGSLEKLRPGKTLVPAVMGAILATSTSKASAAGIGTTAIGVLVKFLPISWLVALIPLISSLPGLGIGWWLGKVERGNYRDSGGFRAKIHRSLFRSLLWGFPLAVVLVWVVVRGVGLIGGVKGLFLVMGLSMVPVVVIAGRLLAINRSRFATVMFVYCLIGPCGMLAVGLGWLPPIAFIFFPIFAPLAMLVVNANRPLRMDYNLFLRAAHGMLENPAVSRPRETLNLSRSGLLSFARFLGERWLVVNFRWERGGLMLRLTPARLSFASSFTQLCFFRNSGSSQLALGWDGSVAANCGKADDREIRNLFGGATPDRVTLETQVAEVVTAAWEEYRAGNLGAAEAALGQTAESEIFRVPTASSKSARWMRAYIIFLLVASSFLAVMGLYYRPNRISSEIFKPVSVSAEEVRASLAVLADPGPDGSNALSQLQYGLYTGHVLPLKDRDFTPAVWRAMRDLLLKGIQTNKAMSLSTMDRMMVSPPVQTAIINGWLDARDCGYTTEEIRRLLKPATRWRQTAWFEPSVIGAINRDRTPADYTVLEVSSFTRRMQFLQRLDCLGAVDGAKAVEVLVQHQMLSTNSPPGRRKVPFPDQWHGLFLTYGYNPIIETYEAVAAVELFHALGRIDKEACVQGILRFHHGKGLFRPVKSGDDAAIFGDERETFCAFESLRMLGALDRVKDLRTWKFRPIGTSKSEATGKLRAVTWAELEAWMLQQRLERDLAEHEKNPASPWRSLLEP